MFYIGGKKVENFTFRYHYENTQADYTHQDKKKSHQDKKKSQSQLHLIILFTHAKHTLYCVISTIWVLI